MSTSTPSPAFDAAAQYLATSPALSKVSNDVKLELYGLFKYVTASPTPTSSRPSLFDFTGRAKWDAWSAAGKKYTDASTVEERYLEMARGLGWSGEIRSPSANASAEDSSAPADEDDIWDKDSEDGSQSGSKNGMGNFVSAMPAPPTDESGTIHALALANDAAKLEALLDAHPEIKLDERDEFGYTPLHLAADRGHVAIVKLLLGRGADRTLKDDDEFTPLELANVSGHTEVEKLLKSS